MSQNASGLLVDCQRGLPAEREPPQLLHSRATMSIAVILCRPLAIHSKWDQAREQNHFPRNGRNRLVSIGPDSSKNLTPWYHRSLRAVTNLRWIRCNTMARSAVRHRSSDIPEPVPRQSNPHASHLAAVSGCHSCRRSGGELPREPARQPAKQSLERQCCCGVARLNHMHRMFSDNHIGAGLMNARTV